MINQFQEQIKQMGAGGEIIIDADPEKGFFRVKLMKVKPEHAVAQFTKGIVDAVAFLGKSMNFTIKQQITEKENES